MFEEKIKDLVTTALVVDSYCLGMHWIYDESQGWPEDGIAAGTKWEDLPDDWTCPDCGVSKVDFEMIEI